jgi:hypothetical protein
MVVVLDSMSTKLKDCWYVGNLPKPGCISHELAD